MFWMCANARVRVSVFVCGVCKTQVQNFSDFVLNYCSLESLDPFVGYEVGLRCNISWLWCFDVTPRFGFSSLVGSGVGKKLS